MPQDPLTQALLSNTLQNQATLDQGPSDPNGSHIGPEPNPFTAAVSRFANQYGLNPDNYKDANTNPLLRLLGAARSVGSTPLGQGALSIGMGAVSGGGSGELPFESPGLPSAPSSSLLKSVFAANPKAEPAYNAMMKSQLPQVMANRAAENTAKYSQNADTHDALLDLHVSDRPHIIKTDTGHAFPVPIEATSNTSVGAPTSSSRNLPADRMSQAGMTPEMIRDIRSLGVQGAVAKYPQMNPNTLRGIANGDVYSQVK